MAWITPVTTWIPSPVGNEDFNRIEGNTKYLREENKTINGTTTFTNNITQTAGTTSLKATTIDSGATNTGLKLISSDYGSVIEMFDSGTINGSAIARLNNDLALLQSGGLLLVGQSSSNGTDLLQVGSNTDISVSMGRAKMGYITTADSFFMSHYDNFNETDFGVRFTNTSTVINTKSTGSVFINNANNSIATFSSSAITMYKNLSMNNGLADGADIKFFASGYDTMAIDNGSAGLRIFNSTLGAVEMTVSSSAITMYEPLTVNGSASISDDLTVDGAILPTTTPTESFVSTTTNGGYVYLPRGIYSSFFAKAVWSSGTGVSSTLQRYDENKAAWVDIYDITASSGASTKEGETLYSGISTGTNIRIYFTTLGTGTGSIVYAKC